MTTKTIGSGGDYTTLAAWASYVNALSLTENEIGQVTGTVTDTSTVTVGGWTANGFTVTLTAVSGQKVSDGGRAWWLTSGRAILTNSATYSGGYVFSGASLTVRGLQIETTAGTGMYAAEVNTGAVMDGCIVRFLTGTQAAVRGAGTAGTIRSSLIITGSQPACRSIGALVCQRVTAVGTGATGFVSDYTGLTAIGCISYGYTAAFSGTAAGTSTHNATSAASIGGTGFGTSGQVSVASGDFVDTGSGTEDFRPASGSTKLVDTGAAISGLSVDLFGTSVPQGSTEDIGAVEASAGGGDTTAPVLSSPVGAATGPNTATVGATTDEGNGTLYVVVTTSATQPSVAQIKAGNDHADAAAAYDSTQAISSTGAKTFSATGLSPSTTYYAHLVHTDAAANDSNVVSSASFTTSALPSLPLSGMKIGKFISAGTDFANNASTNYVAQVYADGTTLGSVVYTSGTLTTSTGGAFAADLESAALTVSATYKVALTNQSTNETTIIELVAE